MGAWLQTGTRWVEAASRGAARRPRTTVGVFMLATTAAVWAPFLGSLDKLYRYWDGPMYLFVAKTLYRVPVHHPFDGLGLGPKYFASHLPLYPLLIRALTVLTGGDYPLAMLAATVATGVASAVLFYQLLREWSLVVSPVWTALLFCLLPPRWLLYHSVGATEPLFLCCALAALLAYRRGRPGWLIFWINLACLTRITGVLLVPVFGALYILRKDWRRLALLPLAGLGLLALFGYYAWVFGDFFAYAHYNIDRLGVLRLRPFAGFERATEANNYRVTELYIWLYVAYGLGTLALWRSRELFGYCLAYFLFGFFILHMDLTRYYLAIAPFALLVAFDGVLSRPAARPILLLVAYLDYTYAWGLLPMNLASHRVWERLARFLAG